jgi:alkaline phosphatase D
MLRVQQGHVRVTSMNNIDLRTGVGAAVTRRAFLASGLALGAFGAPRPHLLSLGSSRATISPFTLGIASGDPSPQGMVLWTRLAPDPLNGGGMSPEPVAVHWEVALDDTMRHPVRRGTATARAEWAHSVHVELNGLEPARWYWYRFRVGDIESPIGRTRTLPSLNSRVDRLRFAFASCQNFEQGLFTAYRHMADEELQVVFHLGDYIYEGPPRTDRARQHAGPEPTTLQGYRNRFAQYKSDPDLQLAHAACPWIVTWDDHDVSDNYAGAISHGNDPRDQFLARRACAYQAYYEHLPLRRASMPHGPDARLYRDFRCGDLAAFFVLDTRQYRTDQPCGDNTTWPCGGMLDPQATMLGATQERWLFDGLHRSHAKWHLLPQQVMIARVNRRQRDRERYSMDQWPGYEVERMRLLHFLGTRRPANPVVLTGDLHSNWVNDLATDDEHERSTTVATEFVGTSISSGGDGFDFPDGVKPVLEDNSFVKFYNEQRGYVSCEITPNTMRARFRVLDYVTRPGGSVSTRATFVVESGRPGALRE